MSGHDCHALAYPYSGSPPCREKGQAIADGDRLRYLCDRHLIEHAEDPRQTAFAWGWRRTVPARSDA